MDRDELIKEIKDLSRKYLSDTIEIRRDLHRHPELSFEEKETEERISGLLERYGIPFQRGVGGHGVIGLIRGGAGEGKTIALRADMDALPVQEANDVEYRSVRDGVMHACGHDLHIASLIISARILHEMKDHLPGRIRLIFQPAEERAPGGAQEIIKAGVLEDPPVDAIFGQHVNPMLPAGEVGIKPGLFMASVDEVYLTVQGKGGHGARPQNGVDPILIAANIIMSLQQINSRNSNPTTPTVLTFGQLEGRGSTNVIPDTVKMAGTLRTVDEEWREEAHGRIREIAENIAKAMGGECEVNIQKSFPCLENDSSLSNRALKAAKEYAGEDFVKELDIAMWSEDFAYYAQRKAACFYNLGVRNDKKGINSMVHTSTFDIDESALELSPGMMAFLAASELLETS